MFNLFASKNQKLVHKWKKEHHEIVVLATKVIEKYSTHHYDEAKKYLIELNSLAVEHIMDEDIQFFKLLREKRKKDKHIENMINEFTHSFKDTKLTLMNFLHKYTKDDVELDDEFFATFNKIVEVVGKRIAFEENNLYKTLEQ